MLPLGAGPDQPLTPRGYEAPVVTAAARELQRQRVFGVLRRRRLVLGPTNMRRLAEVCDVGPARTELSATLYGAWKIWAEAAGEYAGSIRRLSESLAARGFEKWREPTSTRMGFRGIALKPATTSTAPLEFRTS